MKSKGNNPFPEEEDVALARECTGLIPALIPEDDDEAETLANIHSSEGSVRRKYPTK